MADGDGQTALDEYAGEDGDDHGEDDLDALRDDVARLADMVDTLTGAQQDLADVVGELADDGPTDATDTVDEPEDALGFQ